jgi:hypothetical protein
MAAFTSTAVPDFVYGTTNTIVDSIESTNELFNTIDKNFDGTFNAFISHAFTAGKEANETYTFRDMLKQED